MIKMNEKQLHKSHSETEHVLFAELFPDLTKEKNRDRAFSILEATIMSYRTRGIENTTYEVIAKAAGISRPLIFKYFNDYEDLFYKSIKFIRVHFQAYAVDAIRKAETPTAKLEAYLRSTFDWLDQFPAYASGLLLYLQRCSWQERDRDLNTQFTATGRARVAALIRLGVESGEFSCADPDLTAVYVHTVVTGAVVTLLSEGLPQKARYRMDCRDLCLGLVGVQALRRSADTD